MLKSVIFDMDGVLIDSHPVHKRAWRKFFETLGKEVPDQHLDFVLDGRKKEDILRHFLGNLPDHEIHEYGHRKEMLFREQALTIKPIKGVLRFLNRLKSANITFALASSGSRTRVHYILTQLAIQDWFNAIVTGDDVDHGKPDPAIFRKAAEKLECHCSEVVVIEDAVSGVKAAKAAGMKCVGIADAAHAKSLVEAGASRIMRDFEGEPLELLFELFETSSSRPVHVVAAR